MKFVLATLIFANIGCLYKNIKRDKKLKQKEQELIFSENKKEFLDKYYELIKRNDEEISIIKHDIYNNIFFKVISTLFLSISAKNIHAINITTLTIAHPYTATLVPIIIIAKHKVSEDTKAFLLENLIA